MKEWIDMLLNSLQYSLEQIIFFIPKIIGALILLSLGFAASKLTEKLFYRLFVLVGIPKIASKSGVDSFLASLSLKSDFTKLLSRLLFWIIFIIFLLPVSNLFGMVFVSELVNTVIAFMPNIIVALIILLAGAWAAKVLSGLARGSAARVGSEYAEVTGTIVSLLIMLVTIVISLLQLKIEISILSYIIISLFAAFSFGLALAFALGVKDIIKALVSGTYIQKSVKRGQLVYTGEVKGEVIETGAVFTIIRDSAGQELVLPNWFLFSGKI